LAEEELGGSDSVPINFKDVLNEQGQRWACREQRKVFPDVANVNVNNAKHGEAGKKPPVKGKKRAIPFLKKEDSTTQLRRKEDKKSSAQSEGKGVLLCATCSSAFVDVNLQGNRWFVRERSPLAKRREEEA